MSKKKKSDTSSKTPKMTNKEFIASMAENDSLIDHNIEECGMCFHQYVMAQSARDMLAKEEIDDKDETVISRCLDEAKRRWEAGKYFKLWQDEKAAGRDPHKAFEERGWEP